MFVLKRLAGKLDYTIGYIYNKAVPTMDFL